ncbi:MAG: TRAP transporter large permease [Atribacterota bacterium]|nr:TRAP transporter large permease [Atribacterota bacterium]
MGIIIASLVILISMFIGIPIAFSFLFGSILYMLVAGEGIDTIVTIAFFSLNNFSLLALPLFIIAGNLMDVTGIASVLVNFAEALLKKVKGGMGAVIPLASMFFGALCGSGTATVATLGVILLPKLTKNGWDKRYTSALLAASGPLGYMIPPNVNAILYSFISDASVAALFLATLLPGILWGGLYMVINRIIYAKYNPNITNNIINTTTNTTKRDNYWRDLRASSKGMVPAATMPVIILGGIYGGVFTPTEAGAVSCIYAIAVGIFVYKSLNFRKGFSAFTNTAKLLGSFFIILAMAMVFTRILVINGIPQSIATGMLSLTGNRNVLLLLIAIVFVICGFFLDANILVMVITPLMLPLAHLIELNIIQMGVILMVAIGIGTLTPPMALSLYLIAEIADIKMQDMLKPLTFFILFAAIPILLLVVYVPAFSLWLPKVIMGISY